MPITKHPIATKLASAAVATLLIAATAGCTSTQPNEQVQAKRTIAHGTFDKRCYFAMKAVEISTHGALFNKESGESPLTVCTVGDDGSSLSIFFFDPQRFGGSTLFTVSLPDYQVLSAQPQK